MAKRKKEFDYNKLTPQELMRFEVAQELGLDDKIVSGGWGALSARESGRIGGIIASRTGYETMFISVAVFLVLFGWPVLFFKTRYDEKKAAGSPSA